MSERKCKPMQANASLTAKQHQLVALLIAGSTIVAAASACRVNESTAHRWLHQEAMQEALRAGRADVFEASLEDLKRLMPKAIATLQTHLESPVMVTAATQLGAARTLIEQSIELFKVAQLEERLQALEDILAEQGKKQ
jgi:hypothetical protein